MKDLNPFLKKINTTIVIHILIWVFFVLITAFQSYSRFNSIPTEFYILNIIFISTFYLNHSFLVPKLLLNRKIYSYLLISIVFILLIIYVLDPILRSSRGLITEENILSNRLPYPPQPHTRMEFKPTVLLFLFFTLSTCIKLVSEWYKSEKERTLVATQKVSSELSFLKAQLNPHFLFNTLNSIYSLANKKSENTTEAIITLSELMRYMIYEANEETTLLEKEIDYIKNYISLQLLRLKDSSGVKINVHGDLTYKIEPLLLISFIENAFKYGTDYKGNTDIKIKISVLSDTLNFMVYNACHLKKEPCKNSGIGLENIKNRLNLLYPNSHSLVILNQNNSFEVNLTIKLKK